MMNVKKVTALIMVICMAIGMLSGCTAYSEGKALYDAMIKSQSIKSSQSEMQFTLRMDATGLSEEDQLSFAQAKAMLNGANMSMKMKQSSNADNTASKAQVDMGMHFAGMSIEDMAVWVDMDLSGNTLKFKEIVKLPAMMTAMDPSLAGKEYIVMDFSDIMTIPGTNGQEPKVDYSEIMKHTKELQDKTLVFLGKYLAQYDPGFKFISDAGMRSIVTPERTLNAHVYQVKLDDKAAKKLLRYTVNNMANNKDVVDFAVEYMKFLQKFVGTEPGGADALADLNQAIADFEKNKPAMLAEFNKAMDQIENIQLIGDKGIMLEYAIDENGYIVSQSGSMDFIFDTAKLDSLEDLDGEIPSTGVYNLGFDFSMLSYNINKAITIEMPAVTPENSLDYTEMMNNSMPSQPEQPDLGIEL